MTAKEEYKFTLPYRPCLSQKQSLETIAYQLKRIADFLQWIQKQCEENKSEMP